MTVAGSVNTGPVFDMARVEQDRVSHRDAATAIAVRKVRDAKKVRGLFH